jgi:hypothetical protein
VYFSQIDAIGRALWRQIRDEVAKNLGVAV